MIEVGGANKDSLPISGTLLANEALRRGWRMWAYDVTETHYRLQRPDGVILEMYESTPPTMSGVALLRTDSKYITQKILETQEIPTLEAHKIDLLTAGAQAIAREYAHLFDGRKWVLKPLDAAHGLGITTEIQDTSHLERAVAYAQRYSSQAILQEYYNNFTDVRILCIDGEYIAAAHRVPARVQGDGIHTVKELISIENQRGARGPMGRSAFTYLNTEVAEAYLQKQINTVPRKDEWTQVSGIANASMGGETIDITDEVPVWLRDLALKAADTLHLPVCGVDILLSDVPWPEATYEQLNPVIIELNKAPGLRVHEGVTHGVKRPVTRRLFDYLEKV